MSDYSLANKSQKCRPLLTHLINSPPSNNKSPTWSPRFLHKLTVVAHPARLQQLHFQPDFFFFKSPPIFFSTNNPSSDQLDLRTIAKPPSLCLKLWPTLCCSCDSTPSLQPHPRDGAQQLLIGAPDDRRGDTSQSRKCFRYF